MDVYISTMARCSAIETHLRRHLFFQRSSSSSMFLGPSCDVSRVGHVNHVSIWYRELGTKVDSLTQPLHPVPWNKKEYMSTRCMTTALFVLMGMPSYKDCAFTSESQWSKSASPIPSTGIYSHLDSVRLWNTSLHSPSRKRLHVTEGWLQHLTSGWDHQKLPLARTPAPEKYSAHLRLRKVRFRK